METILSFFQVTSGLDVELSRITFITSLVIALTVYHQNENIPIGIIAPGTIFLLFGYPTKLLLVLFISLLVYISALVLQKYIFPNTIFAAREKLLIFVFLSIIFSLMGSLLFSISIEVLTAGAIGIVLPAMIAENLTKPHRVQSLRAFFLATTYTIIFFVCLKFSSLYFLSDTYKAYLDQIYPTTHVLSNSAVFVMYLLFAGATILNFILYRKIKFKSAGLLLGAYLGLLMYQPSQILFIAIVVTIAYVIMQYIYKHSMLFGYRIFVLATLIVSTIYALAERAAFIVTHGEFQAFIGLHIAGIVVCGLLVSETVQHGYKKVVIGSFFMTIFIACLLYTIQLSSPLMHLDFTIASLINRTKVIKHVDKKIVKKREGKKKEVPKAKTETLEFTHVVKYGESVSMLSLKYCHTLRSTRSIAVQNHLAKPDIIHPGETITFNCTL